MKVVRCKNCKGTGSVGNKECPYCHGTGTRYKRIYITLKMKGE